MAEPQQPVDQQVTSKTPATKQKNPKRVAAGKAIAEKTTQAREAQKKALAEAQIIIANNQLKLRQIKAWVSSYFPRKCWRVVYLIRLCLQRHKLFVNKYIY